MKFCMAWVLYFIGMILSEIMNIGDRLGAIYPLYNKIMIKSSHIQGIGPGPWYNPEKKENGASGEHEPSGTEEAG